jgi:hypothetical protein
MNSKTKKWKQKTCKVTLARKYSRWENFLNYNDYLTLVYPTPGPVSHPYQVLRTMHQKQVKHKYSLNIHHRYKHKTHNKLAHPKHHPRHNKLAHPKAASPAVRQVSTSEVSPAVQQVNTSKVSPAVQQVAANQVSPSSSNFTHTTQI